MKLPFIAALVMAGLVSAASADDNGTLLVPNNHGGYNVNQQGAHRDTIAFFGTHGYASIVIAHSKDQPSFIIRPVVEDVGHGGKIVVYKKIYFATPEEAAAAKLKYY